MTTAFDTLVDDLTQFEYDQCCTFTTTELGEPKECEESAEFFTISACCGIDALKCERHLYFMQTALKIEERLCIRCRRVFPKGTSLSERYIRIERI